MMEMNRRGPEDGEDEGSSRGGGGGGGGGGRPQQRWGAFYEALSRWVLPGASARASYLSRASCLPPPVFIVAASAAELSVFIYYAVWKPQRQWVTLDSGIWESPLTYRPDKRREAWRFWSYMLVHAGIEHILGNLVLQLVLGIPLELVHKGHRVGLVYLAGVLGGSLASSVCDPLLGLVGASGGVYALIGGYFMNVLVNFKEMIPLFGVARLLFIFLIGQRLYWWPPSPVRLRGAPHAGMEEGKAGPTAPACKGPCLEGDLAQICPREPALAAMVPLCSAAPPPACPPSSWRTLFWVSFVAHIAGGLAGMSVGYVIFSSFDENFVKDPRFWVCIIGYLLFMAFAVLFNVFFSPANP